MRGGITRTLSYGGQDHLVRWSSSVNSQEEWNLYDASGERVLRRTCDGTNTVLTVFAFGDEEHASSNPTMALLQFLARMALKGALSTVISVINDGLRNIVSSLYHVDQGVKIVLDIAAVILDVVGIVSTIQFISQAVKMLGMIKEVGWAIDKAAELAVRYYKGEISLGVVTNVTRVRNLATSFPNSFLGTSQLFTDFTDLGRDASWW